MAWYQPSDPKHNYDAAISTKHINGTAVLAATCSALYGLSQLKSASDKYNEYQSANNKEDQKNICKWEAIKKGTTGLIGLVAACLILLQAHKPIGYSSLSRPLWE